VDDEVSRRAGAAGVAAAGVAALMYLTVARWWDPAADALVVVAALYAVAVIGAGICTLLLWERSRTLDDPAPRWLAAGLAIAGCAALAQGFAMVAFVDPTSTRDVSRAAGPFLVWHAVIPLFVLGAVVAPAAASLRRTAIAVGVVLLVASVSSPTWTVVPALVDGSGRFTPVHRGWVGGLLVLTFVVAVVWIVRCGRRPMRVDAWITVALFLAALDLLLVIGAERPFETIWWSSVATRAATFAVPAVGLLADAARSLRLLHLHERSLTHRLDLELERATRSMRPPTADPGAPARIRAALAPGGIRCVYQPIHSLVTGDLVAVEALARFPGADDQPPDRRFAEAHAVGSGVALEVAAVGAAIAGAEKLPADIILAVNVSPAALVRRELVELLAGCESRPVIVEVTEHAAVEDYHQLADVVAELRGRGIRLAIDDAGAGFASLRHIVRLVPDVIKLDMSLTRDIHLDPVRRSLAASLVDFAEQIGAVLVAEGVERSEELEVMQDLGAHAAQGYLLGRPGDLPVAVTSDLVPGRVIDLTDPAAE
jgi:EAL domain-containing protein (putative c-di-GMP-specific phosphodiesterase class I)